MDFEYIYPVLILFGSFAVMLAIGVPITFAIGLSSLLSIITALPPDAAISVISQKMTVGLDGFTLLAIPFFVLAGNIMNTGGIARRLVNPAQALVGRLHGSLAHCNILANTLFGAISGSAVASAAAVGGIMSPLQEKRDMIRRFQQRLILPLPHWPDDPTEQCVDCLFPRQWRDFCRCVVLSWISAGHPHRCCLNVCSCTLCPTSPLSGGRAH